MVSLVVSINVHEKPDFLLKQLENLAEFVLESYVVILSCNEFMFSALAEMSLPNNVIINPEIITKRRYHGSLTQGIYSNMKYAVRNMEFSYFIILSSRTIFTKKINLEQLKILDINFKAKYLSRYVPQYAKWKWRQFKNLLLYKHYFDRELTLYNARHEGLVFSQPVCENIIYFLELNEVIRTDLFNFGNCVEELALQTISMHHHYQEHVPNPSSYGFIQIWDYFVALDPEDVYVTKISRR